MAKKGNEYRLRSTGSWIVSAQAQKVLDRIERRRGKRHHHKGQKKK